MMYQRLRIFTSTFLTNAIPVSTRHHSPYPVANYRAIFLGAALGLVGGNLVLAEKSDSRPDPNSGQACPKHSSYKYVICGGGVAAKEALKVFAEHKCAEDVLLISPEWNERYASSNETDGAASLGASDFPDEAQFSVFSKAFRSLSSSLAQVSPPPPKSAEIVVGRKVSDLDPVSRLVTMDDGTQISFEKCLIAVGVSPPPIPIGNVVSNDASQLVGTAWSSADWQNMDDVIRNAFSANPSSPLAGPSNRAHITVVGGGWMSAVVGTALIDRGADVTFSYADPSFLSRCLPKYLSRDIYNRLMWLSDGGIDLLSYAALRYVVARRARTTSEDSVISDIRDIEAEVHVGTVFDAFSVVDFRTDFVVFAPTLPPAAPIQISTVAKRGGAFVANAELAIASDVYVAGACADVITNINDTSIGYASPALLRWSADYARATGRHAALNMLGARKPYPFDIPAVTVDLSQISLKVTILGNVNGSLESFGYFLKSREPDSACGGGLERGVLFCVKAAPLRFRGAPMQLTVTGVALWNGVAGDRFYSLESVKANAIELLRSVPKSRIDLEAAMDNFAAEHMDISLFDDEKHNAGKSGDESAQNDRNETKNGPRKPDEENSFEESRGKTGGGIVEDRSGLKPLDTARRRNPRAIWRRHQPARIVPLRDEELLWVDDAWLGTASSARKVDKKTRAFTDLMKKNASRR